MVLRDTRRIAPYADLDGLVGERYRLNRSYAPLTDKIAFQDLMSEWQFEYSMFTVARREDAWRYWSVMRNHARMEPGVNRIELDGPFETGTTARTIADGFTQELELADVVDGCRFTVIGYTPDGKGSLSFTWEFKDHDGGSRITHRIKATGPDVEKNTEEFRQMEIRTPEGIARLMAELDRLANDEWNQK